MSGIFERLAAAELARDEAVREKVLATQTAQRLMAERDALAALLREAHEFWAHYSSLNEGAQDDMNAERHEMLGKMSDALDGTKDAT